MLGPILKKRIDMCKAKGFDAVEPDNVALKNDLEQIPDLVDDFDFAINEQCHQYAECGTYKPFLDAGKAVLHVEYELTTRQFCSVTKPMGMSSMRKDFDLTVYRQAC